MQDMGFMAKVEFNKQNKLLLSQTPVCLLISVFSASKMPFCFLKPQFAYSNPSLLTHFGVFRKQNAILLSQTPVCLLI